MAITFSAAAETAAENGAADAVAALVNAGSGNGRIVLLTAGEATVATCVGQATFFGSASNGTATQNGNATDSNATGSESEVVSFELQDGDSTMVLSGSVGESGADLNLDDGEEDSEVIIEAGAQVTISGCQLAFSLV